MKVVNYFGVKLLLRVFVLLGITVFLGAIFGQEEWFFSQIVLIAIWVALSVEISRFVHRSNGKIATFIANIRYNELAQRNSGEVKDEVFKNLDKAMSDIVEELAHYKAREATDKELRATLLESHPYGLLVYDQLGKVHFQNDKFTELTEVPAISGIEQVKPHRPKFYEDICQHQLSKSRFMLDARPGDDNVKCTSEKRVMNGREFYLLRVMPEKHVTEVDEQEHWLNLIKMVNHEVRNGITPMISLSESLLARVDEVSEGSRDVFTRGLKTIKSKASDLARFSDEYRRIIQIPPPNKVLTTWMDLLNEVLDAQSSAFMSTLKFDVVGDALKDSIKVDSGQMVQVFVNLIRNSLTALQDVKSPHIVCSVNREKLDYVIQFSDNGSGINKVDISSIFVPFVSTQNNGSGIGLSICRKIIQNHGGTIRLLPTTQEGTTFIIRIPAVA